VNKTLPYFLPISRSLIFILGGLMLVTLAHLSYEDAIKWWTPLVVVYNLITIMILFLVCKREGIRFIDLIGHVKGQNRILPTAIFALLMVIIGGVGMIGLSFLCYGGLPEFMIHELPLGLALVNVVLLPVTIVLAEMPLYFGYSMHQIQKQTKRPIFAMSYVIFFYALQHSFIPLLFDFKYMAYRFLSFLPLMIFLGIDYSRKKNLTKMMIGHAVMDLSTAVQILVMSLIA